MRISIILLFLVTLSCADHRNGVPDNSANESYAVHTAFTPEDENEPSSQSAIIKSANYRFQVENVESSTKNIESIVKQFNGSVADMNLVSVSTEISNTFTIRVPAQNFEALMDALGADATFTNYKRISTEDVSEEFVDIESRLRTKKEVRDRYIDILKNKAKTVAEVLKAEEQIRILQEEIEAKEGRLKYLQSRVALSTIHLEIYQHVTYQQIPDTYEKPYQVKLEQGFLNGWDIVTAFILILVNIWPILVVGFLVFAGRNWIQNKMIKKSTSG